MLSLPVPLAVSYLSRLAVQALKPSCGPEVSQHSDNSGLSHVPHSHSLHLAGFPGSRISPAPLSQFLVNPDKSAVVVLNWGCAPSLHHSYLTSGFSPCLLSDWSTIAFPSLSLIFIPPRLVVIPAPAFYEYFLEEWSGFPLVPCPSGVRLLPSCY